MRRPFAYIALAPTLIGLTACQAEPNAAPDPNPQDQFWEALSSHCGSAYAGKFVSSDAADANFAGAELIAHVAQCSEERIAIPFHVSTMGEDDKVNWDRSRTWLITRTEAGLRLKHDHRHEDGSEDEVTQYGGDTADEGSARKQDFPVDAFSIELFERVGYTASVTNVWSFEAVAAGSEGAGLAYQLERTVEGGAPEPRFFRVEFDASEEVKAPPAAWGWE
ncbi:MAG: hypothetical protein AAF697_03675 [Pseudomonadota bacterium]